MPLTTHAPSMNYPTINSKTTVESLIEAAAKAATMALDPPDPVSPAVAANPAVARCNEAYSRALTSAQKQQKHTWEVSKLANTAYRVAMPPLIGRTNIREFIACIANAILLQVIESAEAGRLLYAAQIAYSAADQRPHRYSTGSRDKSAAKAPASPEIDDQAQQNE